MNRILERKVLNPQVTLLKIDAPLVARKAEPGQFIILRPTLDGERIPLTVADFDRKQGSVTVIFQVVGATTERLNHLMEGDFIADFAGPLGRATRTEGLRRRRRGRGHRLSRGQKAAQAGVRGARRDRLPE